MRTSSAFVHFLVCALAPACAEPSTVPTGSATGAGGGAVTSSSGQGGQGAATTTGGFGGMGGTGGGTTSAAGGSTAVGGGGGAGGGGPVVTLTKIEPNDALAITGGSVTLTGTGFSSGMTAAFGSTTAVTCAPSGATSATCSAPSNAGVVALVDVTIDTSSQNFTLPSSFTYTGVRNETDVTSVAAGEADYCNLQAPASFSVTAAQATQAIYGRIYEVGVTVPAGANAGVLAEVGFGPTTADPTTQTGWRFQAATFNVQSGNDDEYSATFVAPTAGTYAYTYRFSQDAGLTFTYCDLNGAGSDIGLTFEAAQLGVMTVN